MSESTGEILRGLGWTNKDWVSNEGLDMETIKAWRAGTEKMPNVFRKTLMRRLRHKIAVEAAEKQR